MNKIKLNCWEYFNCGREPNGIRSKESGVCPATINFFGKNINTGLYHGRYCWKISGTFCSGEYHGINVSKHYNCSKCEFFNLVKAEEGENFVY